MFDPPPISKPTLRVQSPHLSPGRGGSTLDARLAGELGAALHQRAELVPPGGELQDLRGAARPSPSALRKGPGIDPGCEAVRIVTLTTHLPGKCPRTRVFHLDHLRTPLTNGGLLTAFTRRGLFFGVARPFGPKGLKVDSGLGMTSRTHQGILQISNVIDSRMSQNEEEKKAR